MNSRPWRRSIVVAVLVAVGLLLTPEPPTTLGSDGPCPGTTGVTVVVDFQQLGGGVVTRCAPGSPASGFKALTGAGFSIAEVQNVPGFLCRIAGKPTPSQDACVNTPPASAYWSYWHASRGGSWITSQEGGKTRKPPAGSVDGWSFSDDGSPGAASAPGIAPPAAPKPATAKPATPKPATPRPTTAQPVTPRPATAIPATPVATAQGPSAEASASDQPTASATPSSSASASDLSSESSSNVAEVVVEPSASAGVADPDTGSASATGPPLGTLLGLGLVIVIGGAALLVARRRTVGGNSG